jgi:RNA polymerase-binding transcription factor DksA
MAKKVQKKGKTAKKAAKPAKKAAKKPVKKVAAKKSAPKKAKPAKKSVKKVAKKAAPKKAAAKKKVIAKKPVKKAAPKKAIKKVIAKKKPVAKKPVKPVKKVIAKKAEKPVKKVVAPVVKEKAKAVVPAKPLAPVAAVKTPAAKKKESYTDLDDDGKRTSSDMPMIVEYKTPSIRRPQGPAPKPHINTDKRTRYSDAELKEFKLLILKKLEEAQKDYELLKSTLSHKDDHGTDDTSPTFKLLEDGSDVLSKEETSHLAGRQEKFIQNLQNALIRIENKTYGICRATGKLISKERLRSVPHATLAIEAKLEQNA